MRQQAAKLAICATILFAMLGCRESGHIAATDDREVLILAAASTQDALDEIAAILRDRRGTELIISPAGSNALARQILAGAPGDLFLSANQAWADEVAKQGFAADSIPLLSGQLVIVVPSGNPAQIHKPDDLLTDRVHHVALADEYVPAGMYAQQALRARGLYDDLMASGRIVRGQNVRFALAFVERQEAEAGIVYASDATMAPNVEIAYTFSPDAHDPIVYPLVLLKHGSDHSAAREVFEFLQSQDAAEIFEKHGFRPLTATPNQTR